MSKYIQKHLLGGHWHIEFTEPCQRTHAFLHKDDGTITKSLCSWTESEIKEVIDSDNPWSWLPVAEAVEVPVSPTTFDAYGFYKELEQVVADAGCSTDEPVLDFIKEKLRDNKRLEEEAEGVGNRSLISMHRAINIIGNSVVDMNQTVCRIDANTDETEALSRFAIIAIIFAAIANVGTILVAASMFGGCGCAN